MPWERIRFEQIKVTAVRNLHCPGCGKKFRRQRTFSQTVNPYNRNPAGRPKTRSEVAESVSAEASTWSVTPERCPDCPALTVGPES